MSKPVWEHFVAHILTNDFEELHKVVLERTRTKSEFPWRVEAGVGGSRPGMVPHHGYIAAGC